MKYIDFKRYKFSTILKNINFRRYNFSKIYKYLDIRRYNLYKIYKSLDISRYNFYKIYKYLDIRRYNFYKIYRYLDIRRYNFLKIHKYLEIKKYKNIPSYLLGFFIFILVSYLSIPFFYSYDKQKIERIVCNDLNIKCSIKSKIKYNFYPTPRLKFSNFIIKDLSNANLILANIKNVEVKISLSNLLNKDKLNYTKIKLKNAEIFIDLKKLNNYKNLYYKKNISKPINLNRGELKFFEGKKYITSIKDVNLKYRPGNKEESIILKGVFLGDDIHVDVENKKDQKDEKKPSTILVFKFINSKILAKLNLFDSKEKSDKTKGNILLKKNKNRLTAIFDYEKNQINIKHSNIKNTFLDGKFDGKIKLFPFFDANLNVNLNGVNFNRLHSFIAGLDKEKQRNLFKINKKINGKINLSVDKIYSKHTLINSFESQIELINGNILINQLLANLKKLGAADITGVINNEKKFSNFIFENNIFLDSQKRFYNKFGIYNKEKTSSHLFVSGSFDLVNFNLRLNEIFSGEKISEEDMAFIEKEFNNLMLEDGYSTLFNFLKLKEFIQEITPESN